MQVRDRGRGRRPAQRPVGRVQGARGIVPGRHGGGHGVEDGQGRVRRRHGHPADPQVRPRLRGRRQVRQSEDRGLPEHDRDDAGGVERSDARAASWREASSTAAPTSFTPRRAPPGSACCRRPRTRGRLAIGVDSNQNHLQPGTVLTSMVKRVDLAVFDAFKTRRTGRGSPACVISASPRAASATRSTSTTARLITPEMERRLQQARADIVAGKIKVTDYMAK